MLHQELNKTSMKIIVKLFKDYYKKASIRLPHDYALREFAIQPFDSDTYIRHLAFKAIDDLRSYIQSKTPKHLYYSSAKYENPGLKDMESKKWLGSDLVFDIDTDHIPGCKEVRYWFCPKGHMGLINGEDIKSCPICGEKVDKIVLVDDECVIKGLNEVIKLVDVLVEDFGFSRKDVKIYFSGHRGYHVHVELDNETALMSSEVRREIIDYMIGLGLDLESLKLTNEKHGRTKYLALLPRIDDYGWRRRLAITLIKQKNTSTHIHEYINGLTSPSISTTVSHTGIILDDIIEQAKILVDEKVTIDIHRLIRVPGSLNGKTGLKVIDIKDLHDFSLSLDLSPFKGYAIFKPMVDLRNITILGTRINISKDTPVKIELGLAVYLALKNVGEIKRII